MVDTARRFLDVEPASPLRGRSTPIGELVLDAESDDTDGQFVIRHNPASDECVLYVKNSLKPRDYIVSPRGGGRCRVHERPPIDPKCPFCPGNEHMTATEIASNGWARCFANRFPILHPLGTGRRTSQREIKAAGRMEVIVAARDHNDCIALQDPEDVLRVVELWRDRYRALLKLEATRHVTMFVNHGARAGGSLQHAHFQIVALQFVPPLVMRLVRSQARCPCVMCEAIERARDRMIFETDRVAAFAETATHSGTVWIVPKKCEPRIGDDLGDFALALHTIAKLAYTAWDDPDFNIALYSAPKHTSTSFHWYAIYVPHLVEDCSLARIQYGMPATSMLPEIAAATLKLHNSVRHSTRLQTNLLHS